jgi:hypothetical protein
LSHDRVHEQKHKSHLLERHLDNERETNFETLLHEQIKDPDMLWSKAKTILQYDERYREMDSKQAESLFRKHLMKLLEVRKLWKINQISKQATIRTKQANKNEQKTKQPL